jgi:hypothetical protein
MLKVLVTIVEFKEEHEKKIRRSVSHLAFPLTRVPAKKEEER